MGQFYSQLRTNCCGSRKPKPQDPTLNECLISLVNTEFIRNDEAAEQAELARKAQFLDSLMALTGSSQFQSLISLSIASDEYYGVGKTEEAFVVVDCLDERNRIILGFMSNREMQLYEGDEWKRVTADSTGVSSIKGKKWEGGLRENQPFGYGVLYNDSGKKEYEGYLYKQMKVGYGIEFFRDSEAVLYDGCFYNNRRHGFGVLFNQDGSTEYEGYWRKGRRDTPSFNGAIVDSPETKIHIPDDSFCNVVFFELMYWLHSLRELVVGRDCFAQTRIFLLDGLSQLERVEVGERSFSSGLTERTDGICRIIKCPHLKSVLFKDSSFADYSIFDLESLPSLQSLHLGGCCFIWSPNLVLTSGFPRLVSSDRPPCFGVGHVG